MKKLAMILWGLFIIQFSYTQKKEFKQYANGLIYSEPTMKKLKYIVDTLNSNFRKCELDKSYYVKYQARAHYIKLEGTKIKEASEDLKNNISYDAFLDKYPEAYIEEDLLVARFTYINNKNHEVIDFTEITTYGGYGHEVIFVNQNEINFRPLKNEWIFKKEAENEVLKAFFFTIALQNKEMAEKYARMIQYANCMIDTNTQIFDKEAKYAKYFSVKPISNKVSFMSMRKKKMLLNKMRRTRVRGYCSQDDSPRIHARNIAILSAESINWKTFLRAHLNIMNDYFERNSDGSYAWAQRETYLRELEELKIDVIELMIAISMRIENRAQNQYYGSLSRIGRALSETQYKEELETKLLAMIKDNSLDNYNRIQIFNLYKHYIRYLKKEDRRIQNINELKEAITFLPPFIYEKIDQKELSELSNPTFDTSSIFIGN